MAITFHKTPQAFSPSDNPLDYTYSSNQTAQANFSYVVEVYFNGAKISEDRTYVSNGTKSHINISDKVLSLLPTPTKPTTLVESVTTGLIKIKVHESYGTTPILQANATSVETKIWKASVSPEQFVSTVFDTDYKEHLFLCDKLDKEFIVKPSQDVYLSMIVDSYSANVVIRTYDSDNNFLDSAGFGYVIPIWKMNLNSTILINEGFVMTNVAYFTVQIGTSEIWTIRYSNDTCEDLNQLVWLNDYGVFEQFNFTYKHELSGSIKASGYGTQIGQWSGSNYVYTLESGERNYRVMTDRKGKVFSKHITQLVQNWLVTCLESPRHWLNGSPITVTTATYQKELDEYEDLIAFELGYNFTQSKRSITL